MARFVFYVRQIGSRPWVCVVWRPTRTSDSKLPSDASDPAAAAAALVAAETASGTTHLLLRLLSARAFSLTYRTSFGSQTQILLFSEAPKKILCVFLSFLQAARRERTVHDEMDMSDFTPDADRMRSAMVMFYILLSSQSVPRDVRAYAVRRSEAVDWVTSCLILKNWQILFIREVSYVL